MNTLSDVVGGANLYGGSNYSFTYDRFCSAHSAIYFKKGYLQVPSGVYFYGDFSVTAWIYLKSIESWTCIFDFGNGAPSDNVIVAKYNMSTQIYASIYQGINMSSVLTNSTINLNQWYFISYVLSGTIGIIYINGNQVANSTMRMPNNILRTSNFIGKSNWDVLSDLKTVSNAIYDEMKIYKGAMTSAEIMNEYITSNGN